MTVQLAMQSAAVRIIGRRPPVFFSSSGTFEVELTDLLNECAADIMKSHDWRSLTKFHNVSGDGTATAFPLPTDYDRMVLAEAVTDRETWFWNYTACPDLTTWSTLNDSAFGAITPGWWIILGGSIQFYPAPPAGQEARFPYISKNYATDSEDNEKAAFTADSDTFKLDERLLTLALVWRYRELKGMPDLGSQETYFKALSEAAARDPGSRVIRSRPHIGPLNTRVAWPWPLGGV